MNNTRISVFRWLWANSSECRGRHFLSMVMAGISAILAVVPMVCVYLIACRFFPGSTGDGAAMSVAGISPLLAAAAGAVLLRFAAYLLAMYCSHSSAFDVHYKLRSRIATHLALLPMGFFDHKASGELKKVMVEDVENIEPFLAHYLPDLASAVVLQVVSVALLVWVNPLLTVAALVPMGLAMFMHAGMNKVYRNNVVPFHDNLESINNIIVEYVRGMPVIKAFNRTAHSFGRYKQALQTHLSIAEAWSRRSSRYAAFFWVCLDLGLVFILPAGFLLFINGQISTAELILFLLLGPGIMEPLGRVIMIVGLLDRIGEGIVRIQGVLSRSPLKEANPAEVPGDHTIEFQNVFFDYGKADVLKDVSFVLPQGTITGLIGPSGAGKSTAARLTARFWDVCKGKILIGGVDIRHIPMKTLMNRIAFVFQDVYLMNDTIMENIRMGRPDASDEQVMAAAQSAAAHDFIMAREQGYQTMAGEGGTHLSGGEKQRISIARAILKDAPILILDEVTSSTDPENERHIHAALSRLMAGKTVIVIAHRLQSVMHADTLLLFENGSIRATGTHDQLLKDELYHTLWRRCTMADNWKLTAKAEKEEK